MNNKDLVRLEELLRESENKFREHLGFESIVNEELKAMLGRVSEDHHALDYVSKRLLVGFEEIEKIVRDYLNAISLTHSRIQDVLSVIER